MEEISHPFYISPNHRRVAFYVGKPPNVSLFVYHLDNRQLDEFSPEHRFGAPEYGLVWGKDNQTIYYAREDGNWFHEVAAFNTGTKKVTQLTDYFHTQSYPIALHPKDDALLVVSNLRGALNLRIYNLATADFGKITDYANPIRTAVYSPDGEYITYTANSTHNRYNSDIYIMQSDGFNKRRLFSSLTGAVDTVYAWAGSRLAISSNFDGSLQMGWYDVQNLGVNWLTPLDMTAKYGALSPNAKMMLVYVDDMPHVYSLDQPNDEPITTPDELGRFSGAVWLDDETLLSSTPDEHLFLYNVYDGKVERLINVRN